MKKLIVDATNISGYLISLGSRAVAMLVAVLISGQPLLAADSLEITVYGATGNIGSRIVNEALSRGHTVTGVSRSMEKLASKFDGINAVEGNILDSNSIQSTVAGQDIVIVAINDDRDITDPADHVVRQSTIAMIEALRQLGENAPRVIQVIGAATLEVEPGVLMIETMDLEPGTGPYILINGHKLAWDHYHASPDVKWTIATPSRYIEAGERTGKFRVSDRVVLRNEEGEYTNISTEDFAVSILNEAEQGNYINGQFTAGY